MSLEELFLTFEKHNIDSKVYEQFEDVRCLYGTIVFAESSFNKKYSLDSRSYVFRSDNKRFIQGQNESSIFATNKDGTDICVRLDLIMENNDCTIENCYISNEEGV